MAFAMRKPQQTTAGRLEDVRTQLAAARAQVEKLTAQRAELAEASIGDADAERRYHDTCKVIATTEVEVRRLETAISAMEARAAAELKQAQLREQAALRARVSKILEERIAVARSFTERAGALVADFRKLVDLSDRAYQAWPGGLPPEGVALGNELIGLVAFELFRLGHGDALVTGRTVFGQQNPSLPGPKPPSYDVREQPEKILPLVDAIAAANQFARDMMEGRSNV